MLGPQWSQSGVIFELFGPGIGVMLLYGIVTWIHLSIGKPERLLRWSLVELTVTVSLFLVALPWGPEGIAAAWSISYGTLLIPGFWFAGRPIGFGISALIAPIWRYAAAAVVACTVSGAIMRSSPFFDVPAGKGAELGGIVVISAMFLTLYLGTVILFHWGLAPLRQLTSLLSELTPLSKPVAEVVEGYK